MRTRVVEASGDNVATTQPIALIPNDFRNAILSTIGYSLSQTNISFEEPKLGIQWVQHFSATASDRGRNRLTFRERGGCGWNAEMFFYAN